MSTVFEHARTLVKVLRESDESKQMRRLGAKVKAESRLEALLSDFRKSQFEVQVAQIQGGEPTSKVTEKLEKLSRSIQGEALLHEYLMAEAAYGKMLMEVQQVLSEAFHPEVPGAVKQPKQGH